MKKRMDREKASWRNGCFEKMDNHPVPTIYQTTTLPNGKMDGLSKTFVQIILACRLFGTFCLNFLFILPKYYFIKSARGSIP